jgi:hypothetical protein
MVVREVPRGLQRMLRFGRVNGTKPKCSEQVRREQRWELRTQVRDHPLHIDPHQAGLAHAPHAALRQREEAGPVAANELAFALPG